jgi:hypothetical protein
MCNCNKPQGPVKRSTVKQLFNNVVSTSNRVQRNNVVSVQNELPRDVPELPGETIEDRCQTLAYMLGLDQAVPERVLVAALENTVYMRRLMASSNNIPALYDLINNPPVSNSRKSYSNTELVSKAGKALLRWAVSGFSTIAKEQLKTREDACLSCPNLVDPVSALQRFSAPSSVGEEVGSRCGNMICSSCGCVVRNKIRLVTESCPEHIAGNSAINRWGEPLKSGT